MRAMLLGLAAIVVMGMAQAATPPAQFEVRLVVPCQPGDRPYTVAGGTDEFCLAKEAIIDTAGVVKVQRYPVLPKAVVQITEAASNRLYDKSFENAGERVGVVFNGRLIFVPYISQPVKIKELQITLKDDPDDIDALVAAFPGALAAQ